MARTNKYAGLQSSFSEQLSIFRNDALEAIDQTFRDVVITVGETVIALSPVDTGRFKANWHITFDSPDSETFPEDFDKEGSVVIAQLVAAMNDFTVGQTVYLLNNLPYSVPLEYGHSQKAPSGMVRVTLARFQQIVDDVVRANQI